MILHTLTNWVLETPVTPDPDLVTPTWVGFLATFLIAAAVAALLFDMIRRVRRTTYRALVKEKLDAEEKAMNEADDGAVEPTGSHAAPSELAPGEESAR